MKEYQEVYYDVIVVGGGLSGLCAAIASARHGAQTALIQERPVFGGNASSEIKMHVCGANCGKKKKNLRETGIIEELLLENRHRNPAKSFYQFDTLLWEKARFQENLTIYLNTCMVDCCADFHENLRRIHSIDAVQLSSQIKFRFYGRYFIDATGDAFLVEKAGFPTITGREGQSIYQEPHAPNQSDPVTLGTSLMFKAINMQKPIPFEKPFWAYTFSEEDLKFRQHNPYESDMEIYNIDSGFWWIELAGNHDWNTISDAEKIRDELLKIVYGVWDHIKNQGDHGAENYALDWVQFLPGKRESRRIIGEYVLTENDILRKTPFSDAVAYGGWPMDIHAEGGIWNKDQPPTNFIQFDDCYTIPYRCYIPQNSANTFAVGRIISTSHLAFGSTRVMGTCSIGGQAIGTAAALAAKDSCTPMEIEQKMDLLQQMLLRDDCYIPGVRNHDCADLALTATLTADFEHSNFPASNLINGIARDTANNLNGYLTHDITPQNPAKIQMDFAQESVISEIHIKFDSNLSDERQLQISLDQAIQNIPFDSPIKSIVRDYTITLYQADKLVFSQSFLNNYLRFCRHPIPNITADRLILTIQATNGSKAATIYEIRVYRPAL
ncbi:MAG: FAD-dependent oxidoreductase [Candidatus Merdivicinus sp.]|jgi:hypothetical protein